MEPVISVVVPVYNGAGYLEACFASLAAQTYRRIEVIAVDDASTDKSGALCDRWAEKDPRFQAVHLPENRGPSGARKDRKSTRLNSSHIATSRMPSSA